MPPPHFDNGRHLVPQHQAAFGQVVLVHLLDVDGGSISAFRLTKLVDVSWLTAQRKLRVAMGDQDRLYRLEGIIELDDAFAAPRALAEGHHHVAKVTPPELVDEWLPLEYIVTSYFKNYVPCTNHGISGRYVQECLDELCYRLNQGFWENQIPNRLLRLCTTRQSYCNLWLVNSHVDL